MSDAAVIRVVIAYANQDGVRCDELTLHLQQGATIAHALAHALAQGLAHGVAVGVADGVSPALSPSAMSEALIDAATVGIWGRVKPRTTLLRDGDRIELYAQLKADPKTARRTRSTPSRLRTTRV